MKEIGMWMRENPGFAFIVLLVFIIVVGGGLTECGVEVAKSLGHR